MSKKDDTRTLSDQANKPITGPTVPNPRRVLIAARCFATHSAIPTASGAGTSSRYRAIAASASAPRSAASILTSMKSA